MNGGVFQQNFLDPRPWNDTDTEGLTRGPAGRAGPRVETLSTNPFSGCKSRFFGRVYLSVRITLPQSLVMDQSGLATLPFSGLVPGISKGQVHCNRGWGSCAESSSSWS